MFDIILLIVGMGIVFIFILALYIGYRTASDAFSDVDTVDVPFLEATDTYVDVANRYSGFFDVMFVVLMVLILIASWVVAYLLDNNPIFLAIYLLLGFFMLLVALFIGNAIWDFVTNEYITPYSDDFPMSMFMLKNYLLFSVFYYLTVAIALYIKPGGDSSGV